MLLHLLLFGFCFSETYQEPGCQGFEAEWMKKGIENSTDMKVPIPYGAVVPIKCIDNNIKLSGPDNITCLKDKTFSGLFDIYCKGWIVPVKDYKTKYPVYNNTIKITADNEGVVYFDLYTNTGRRITSIAWSYTHRLFNIRNCGYKNFAVNKTCKWEVYKAATYLNIACDGVTVLHLDYNSDADENPQCSNILSYQTVASVKFRKSDSATRKFYLNDQPGCRGFEAEWMKQKKGIENSTDIEVPIPYGTAVPIKCAGNNSKLSGPEKITCLKDNTFSGLSDIYCSGWIVPVKDYRTKYPVYNNTIKITADSEGVVSFALYTNTGRYITSIALNFEDRSYFIRNCAAKYFTRRELPAAGNKTWEWEVYKAATYLNIKCDGVTVLHLDYNDADENPQCSNNLNYQTVATVEFSTISDSATRKFYLNNRPGCQGFEADWMTKGIENSTDIKVPIPYGTLVPIKCIGNNIKLSGPDNITCLKGNTFSGLSDIYCSGWIVPIKHYTKYPVYHNTIQITTDSSHGNGDEVYFILRSTSGRYITTITWNITDWSYSISTCSNDNENFASEITPSLMASVKKTWEVYKAATYLNIKCNGETVLHYVYATAKKPQCSDNLNYQTVASVQFSDSDSATRKFYLNDSGCRAGSYTTEEGVCELCPAGTFSRTGAVQACTECPNGKTSEAGAASENDCY